MTIQKRRAGAVMTFILGAVAITAACSDAEPYGEAGASTTTQSALGRGASAHQAIARGREIWLTSTFGGEKFFSLILPQPPFSLELSLVDVLTTPRAERFTKWGVLNDPDCADGDATTGGFDKCPDPGASGVVGIRKAVDPTHTKPFLLGVACAACHAGLDAENPPADPNAPTWGNIHLTTGNQYLNVGAIFGSKLSVHDPRNQVFRSWAPGTVDTTAIESDGINNPGIITQFFNFPDRPYFDLHASGAPIHVHRAGQGGEDDAGCEKAALRVYFNIGMCAAECMVPHLANGPGGTQTEIDLDQCRRDCAEFRQAEVDVVDECAFINDAKSTPPPQLKAAPGGHALIDHHLVKQGQDVFEQTCASCHSNGQGKHGDVYSDDVLHPLSEVGVNSCRARSTNWKAGHVWAPFASDEQKARPASDIEYRDVPLLGVWATAPFLHTNRLGLFNADPSVAGRIAAFVDAMDQLLNPSKRAPFVSVTSDFVVIPTPAGPRTLPAGTWVGAYANGPGGSRCPDPVENEGHVFGATLSDGDKAALIEYVKTL